MLFILHDKVLDYIRSPIFDWFSDVIAVLALRYGQGKLILDDLWARDMFATLALVLVIALSSVTILLLVEKQPNQYDVYAQNQTQAPTNFTKLFSTEEELGVCVEDSAYSDPPVRFSNKRPL